MEGVCSAQVQHKTSTAVREGEMNKRKLGSFGLCAMLFALCQSAEAQQPKKALYRIGVLWAGAASDGSTRREALRQGLRDLGYIEEKNIAFEYRYAEGKANRLPTLAAELVRLEVDVIVTTPIATRPAKEATNTIPIVSPQLGDPVGSGLVAILAKRGKNFSMLSRVRPNEAGKGFYLRVEVFLKIK